MYFPSQCITSVIIKLLYKVQGSVRTLHHLFLYVPASICECISQCITFVTIKLPPKVREHYHLFLCVPSSICEYISQCITFATINVSSKVRASMRTLHHHPSSLEGSSVQRGEEYEMGGGHVHPRGLYVEVEINSNNLYLKTTKHGPLLAMLTSSYTEAGRGHPLHVTAKGWRPTVCGRVWSELRLQQVHATATKQRAECAGPSSTDRQNCDCQVPAKTAH